MSLASASGEPFRYESYLTTLGVHALGLAHLFHKHFFACESCHLTWSELFHAQIRVEFDPVLLLPAESYLRQWININNEHFPKNGWASVVYSGELNYNLEEFEKLDHMIARLEKATEEEWYIVCK